MLSFDNYITWKDVENMASVISYQITLLPNIPDYIIGIGRGGLVPATLISHLLDVPLIPINYSSEHGKGNDKHARNTILPIVYGDITSGIGSPLSYPVLGVVDDIVDSGNTMKEVKDFYNKQGHLVHTYCLVAKENAIHIPDLYGTKVPLDSPWINFPWEL